MDTAALQRIMPFAALLDIRVAEAASDRVRLELDWSPELTTAAGVLHGGVLMALADCAGALAAYLCLPEGASGTTTIESKTNLMGAVRAGRVDATATILHVGRTTIVVETTLESEDRLVAKTTQTQAVLTGESS
ncbi:MAG: PaaI family thioesterase [Nocardioides sp.]